MVLGVGIVSAVILAKKQPNYKTRLQKLQQKLKKKPLTRAIMYELPIKRLFSILIIISFIFFFNFFQRSFFQQSISSNFVKDGQQAQTSIIQLEDKYRKINAILKWVKLAYILMIIAVISDLQAKIVVVEPTCIFIKQYSRQNFGKTKKIQWKSESSKIQIVQKGQQKFSHYTNHYAIELINQKTKSVTHILKRADIFQSRKTMIQMSSVLGVQADLKIY